MMTDRIELAEAHQACPTTSRKLLAGGALLIDVREPREVAEAGFDGCEVVNIPLSQLEARWQEVPRDRDVILACAVGARSLKATYFLMYKGYTRVTNMSLGMKRWMERGFPVTGFAKSEGRGPARAAPRGMAAAGSDGHDERKQPPMRSAGRHAPLRSSRHRR
jgi:rhodanese-related sulfurtransferase